MEIRLARDDELLGIADLQVRSRRAAYAGFVPEHALATSAEAWAEARRASNAELGPELRTWVAEREGLLVGFADTAPAREEDMPDRTAELKLLFVAPGEFGSGIGKALHDHAVQDLRSRGFEPLVLWTLEENVRAQRFYERNGWQREAVTRPWWQGVALEVQYRRG